MREAIRLFQNFNSARNASSRTEEEVFHIAEFSSTGQGEFEVNRCLV